MNGTSELLQRYVENGSEDAFRQLVERHIGLVYATALRKMAGDAHAAQDVAQIVFSDLARKAHALPGDIVLAGWLYRHTCLKAAEAIRAESRRRIREQIAVEMKTLHDSDHPLWPDVAPVLDEAMELLTETDRDALVLRFFQDLSLRAIGHILGVNEDTAQKRISRALDKLRLQLGRRGVTCTAAAVGNALTTHARPSAPPGLASSLSATALVVPAQSPALTSLFQTIVLMSKAKVIIAGALILGATATILLQHRANSRLREQLRVTEANSATAAIPSVRPPEVAPRPKEAPQPQPAGLPASPQPRTLREIMQQAIALTGTGRSREEAVKEIEPLLAQVPVVELKEAADLALAIPDRNWRMGFLHMLLRRWAATDGAGALNYLVRSVKGEAQSPLLAGVLPVWAEREPENAWNWLRTDGWQELQHDASGHYNSALKETFAAMGRADFDRGLGHASELQGIDAMNALIGLTEAAQNQDQRAKLLAQADNAPDQSWRRETRKGILSVWAGAQPEEARTYVEGLADPAQRSENAQHIGPVLMGANPQKGAEWWLNQTIESERPQVMKDIIKRWTDADLAGAANWLQTLGNDRIGVDDAKRALAQAAQTRAPEFAMAWANSIADAENRLKTLREVYSLWHSRNTAAAERWLAAANLPPELSSQITRRKP